MPKVDLIPAADLAKYGASVEHAVQQVNLTVLLLQALDFVEPGNEKFLSAESQEKIISQLLTPSLSQ